MKALIAGPTVYICDECVGLCNDIITEAADWESDDLRRILLVLLEDQERTLARFADLSKRARGRLPSSIQDAIDTLGSESKRLRSAVVESLPDVPRADEADGEESEPDLLETLFSRACSPVSSSGRWERGARRLARREIDREHPARYLPAPT